MFTGIIEELGVVRRIHNQGSTLILAIQGKEIFTDIKRGDSIAVNGVCLTVTAFDEESFHVDVMPETFRSTSLSSLNIGSKVNLERAMGANGRFGGHLVTGHVDGIGYILKKEKKENAVYIHISVPRGYSHFMLLKGSISIDGTSLTIFDATEEQVTVSLIPHTVKESVLGLKKVGDNVNLEFDMIGKYLHSFLSEKEKSYKVGGISPQFLKDHGFM
jgi:riboflavin synthase